MKLHDIIHCTKVLLGTFLPLDLWCRGLTLNQDKYGSGREVPTLKGTYLTSENKYWTCGVEA